MIKNDVRLVADLNELTFGSSKQQVKCTGLYHQRYVDRQVAPPTDHDVVIARLLHQCTSLIESLILAAMLHLNLSIYAHCVNPDACMLVQARTACMSTHSCYSSGIRNIWQLCEAGEGRC